MQPSHFHSFYHNGRSDPQFEDADEDGTYPLIPGSAARVDFSRLGVFNTSGSRFTTGRPLINPNTVFSGHSATASGMVPSSHHVMVGHAHDSHRSLLLQSALMNQAVANHPMVASHHNSLMPNTAAVPEAAYLANAAMFNRPGVIRAAAAAAAWRPQRALAQDHHIAFAAGALQGRALPSYRASPPQARIDCSTSSERQHISREMLTSMLRDSLMQDSSRNSGVNEQKIEQDCLNFRSLVAPEQPDDDFLKESLQTTISQEMFRASHQLMSNAAAARLLQIPKHPMEEIEESQSISNSSSRTRTVKPSEVITAAMLKSALEKGERPFSNIHGVKKETRDYTNAVQGEVEWNRDCAGTGLNALIAASFQADGSSDPKLETKPDYAVTFAKETKINDSIVTSETLEPSVTEYTTLHWRCSSVPLSLEEDKHWLSELQCYIRLNFVEAFGAAEEDLSIQGRSRPTFIGQVGMRCLHCKKMPARYRGHLHAYFPSSVAGIYNSVQSLLRTHLSCCRCVPEDVREKIESLKTSSSARGGRKQYWVDSANKLGMKDTARGIIFDQDPVKCKADADASEAVARTRLISCSEKTPAKAEEAIKPDLTSTAASNSTEANKENTCLAAESFMPLVFPEDKHLISDVLFVTFQNMHKVPIVESDQVGCYKGRPLGFIGLSCNHCIGQAGCGRYFPANEASLSQTTTSQTLLNHIRKCRKVPEEVRLKIDSLMRAKLQKSEKPRHGGRKVFFHRLWCRMQGLPILLGDEDANSISCKDSNRKCFVNQSSSTSESDNDTCSEEENQPQGEASVTKTGLGRSLNDRVSSDSDKEDFDECLPKQRTRIAAKHAKYYTGKIPLAQSDDAYWLSELVCFVRNECLEAFSATSKDVLSCPNIVEGQVGIRCRFCSKADQPIHELDYLAYPKLIREIKDATSMITKNHLPLCPFMPKRLRKIFKSLQYAITYLKSEADPYWIDAAKESGMSDWHDGTIRFFRDPNKKGAAERMFSSLDKEEILETPPTLVRKSDRELISDHLFFVLSQVQVCSFDETIDQRKCPRKPLETGFRGVECIHCAGKSSSKGRYFPISAGLFCDARIINHLLDCEFCPEDVKASLEYLDHRVSHKEFLRSDWRQRFSTTLWKRIQLPNSFEINESNENDEETISDDSDKSSERSEGKRSLDSMMIDAAARWLTELGHAVEEKGKRRRVQKKI